MEVFKAFTTLSLADMVSSPLQRIRGAMAATTNVAASLGTKMGKVAVAMAPVAMVAGVVLGVLGVGAAKAIAFESAMADVARVVRFDTRAELEAMSKTVKDLSGRLPETAEGIASVVKLAGEYGVAKDDLAIFAEQAVKMGVAFGQSTDEAARMMNDWRNGMSLTLPQVFSLTDAVGYLSREMQISSGDLGKLVQNVGGLAKVYGLAEHQTAALGAAFMATGAGPEAAGTAMQKFMTVLSRSEAMSTTAADALKSLGFSATQVAKDMQIDAQGTILSVLQALSGQSKDKQNALMFDLFGQGATGTIGVLGPLLSDMGNLEKSFALVGDQANYAGSMQAVYTERVQATDMALKIMRNKFDNVARSVGVLFLPAISWAAIRLGYFADALRYIAESSFGQKFLKIAGALAVGVIGFTAFSGAIWGITKLAPIVSKALLPLKAAILGLGWPFLVIIAAIGLLYAAWRSNFGGIADTMSRWGRNISLVGQGVMEVFRTLTDGTGVIRGELAKEIKAAGLEGFVTTVARVVYRVQSLFAGLWEGLDFTRPLAIFMPIGDKLAAAVEKLGQLFARVFGREITSATAGFYDLGKMVGGAVSWGFEALATVVLLVANGLGMLISGIVGVVAFFSGDFVTAGQMGRDILDALADSLMSIADLFRIGDWLRAAWTDAIDYLGSIDLFESGVRILETLKAGILSAASSVTDSVKGAFSGIRDLLPFSDAKTGPLSELTLSGSRIMTTLAEGVQRGAGALIDSIDESLAAITPEVPHFSARDLEAPGEDSQGGYGRTGAVYNVHIGNITLPDVKDGQGFMQFLQDLVDEYGWGELA